LLKTKKKYLQKKRKDIKIIKMYKCDKVANNFRVKADEYSIKNDYLSALKSYNNCLRFATNKSIESSSAFVARAEIFYQFELYNECLENIELAFATKNNFTSALETKLNEMKVKCENINDTVNRGNCESKKLEFFKLSHDPNAKIPFIADCLEVRENEVYGRFIATNKDLEPGDIIIVEKPFYKVLSPDERNARCAVCLKQNSLNLIPCINCATGKK
jgi:hypothetical protein